VQVDLQNPDAADVTRMKEVLIKLKTTRLPEAVGAM
jgi:hypothetical protein